MFTTRTPLAVRFNRKVIRLGGKACWIWVGGPNSAGYGTITSGGRNGKMLQAHRVAYQLYVGSIPDGLCVCHRCDVRTCVNPKHLFLGTNLDNVRDRDRKGRWHPPSRPGEACGHAKLMNHQVISIRGDPRNNAMISREYSVSRTTISNVKRGITWKHLLTP